MAPNICYQVIKNLQFISILSYMHAVHTLMS